MANAEILLLGLSTSPNVLGTTLNEPSLTTAAIDEGPGVEGVFSTITLGTSPVAGLAAQTGVLAGHYFTDFYYRIWVVPAVLSLKNPRLNSDIAISIWNAYPYSNTLASITGTGLTGIEWGISPPQVFKAIEFKSITFQLNNAAPLIVDADILFNFTEGTGYFSFNSERYSIIYMVPDVPVEEVWQWRTDIIVANDGSEQRIAARTNPRRSITYSVGIDDADGWRTQFKRMWSDINSSVYLPFWQYATRITAAAALGDFTLSLDPTRTDLREEEFVLIVGRNIRQLAKVTLLTSDTVTLDVPLEADVVVGDLITPVFPCLIDSKSRMMMRQTHTGALSITGNSIQPREQLQRPGASPSFTYYEGLIVLDRSQLVDQSGIEYSFDGGSKTLDNLTGVRTLYAPWAHPQIEGPRSFLVPRGRLPLEMDYWRGFLDAMRGRQGAFYLESMREDFETEIDPTPGSTALTLVGTDYSGLYFPYEAFKVLAIRTAAGVHYSRVLTATENVDGNDELVLDIALPVGAGWETIERVSMLVKMRLASDEVKWRHYQLHSYVELAVRTVDQ
jgi:hypothetical protein